MSSAYTVAVLFINDSNGKLTLSTIRDESGIEFTLSYKSFRVFTPMSDKFKKFGRYTLSFVSPSLVSSGIISVVPSKEFCLTSVSFWGII